MKQSILEIMRYCRYCGNSIASKASSLELECDRCGRMLDYASEIGADFVAWHGRNAVMSQDERQFVVWGETFDVPKAKPIVPYGLDLDAINRELSEAADYRPGRPPYAERVAYLDALRAGTDR